MGGAAERGEKIEEGRRRGWCGELPGRFSELEEEVSAGSRVADWSSGVKLRVLLVFAGEGLP